LPDVSRPHGGLSFKARMSAENVIASLRMQKCVTEFDSLSKIEWQFVVVDILYIQIKNCKSQTSF